MQNAYEVLSDPQLRAIYDKNEDKILSGEDGEEAYWENARVTTADEVTRMMGKFNARVDFSDKPTGFFGYLRETFDRLAREEEAASRWEGIDPVDYPDFGHRDDTHDDVARPFYAVWQGFSTRKSFVWKDLYRLSEAPDRRYKRVMERENKRLRDEGIRDFNEAVRGLVAFVRKKDPRYKPVEKTEGELRAAALAQAARARAANEAKLDYVVPEWAKSRESGEEDESAEEEEEVEEEEFECVACRKVFKSEKQYEAHEKSKKHQKAVYALKRKMQKENAHLDLDGADFDASSGFATPDRDVNAHTESVEEPKDEPQDDVEDEVTQSANEELKNLDIKEDSDDELNHEADAKFPTASSEHLMSADAAAPEKAASDSGDEAHPPEQNEHDNEHDDDDAVPSIFSPPPATSDSGSTEPKIGKAALKRAKKAAQREAAAAAGEEASRGAHRCSTCAAAFPSKTRLFQHIKDHPGHAKLVTAGEGKGGGKKGKGRR